MKTIQIIMFVLVATFTAFADGPTSLAAANSQIITVPSLDYSGWEHDVYSTPLKKLIFFYHGNDQSEAALAVIDAVVNASKLYDGDVLVVYRADFDQQYGKDVWVEVSKGATVPSKSPRFAAIDPSSAVVGQKVVDPKKVKAHLPFLTNFFLSEDEVKQLIKLVLDVSPSSVATTQPPGGPSIAGPP